MKPQEVFIKALKIRDNLKISADAEENPINVSLKPVKPFQPGEKVSLVFIGQDPTIKNEKKRANISYTLNLDKSGALKSYIKHICDGLDISFENIYATNVFKYFYTIPPSKTMNILKAHLYPNLDLLIEEISGLHSLKIITLGEPVLQLLAGENKFVRNYWDYNDKTKESNGKYSFCAANENKLGMDFYPFPHQPSLIKPFYSKYLNDYIMFVKS